mmetsp:Transcript_87559/g.157830  ORF Transcript_87559/g.157830 Transcript_87559/m.157830 type:complete len:86 (-) Transcript_87559:198-455(-)
MQYAAPPAAAQQAMGQPQYFPAQHAPPGQCQYKQQAPPSYLPAYQPSYQPQAQAAMGQAQQQQFFQPAQQQVQYMPQGQYMSHPQ